MVVKENNMYIIGISAYYHDSSVCLFKDNNLVFACEEEKFSGIKHDSSFPINALNHIYKQYKITDKNLQCVCYYEDPKLKFKRVKGINIFPFIKVFYNQVQKDKGIIFGWLYWQWNLIYLRKDIDTTEWSNKWERKFKIIKREKVRLIPTLDYFYLRYTCKDKNRVSYKIKLLTLSWLKFCVSFYFIKYEKGHNHSGTIFETFCDYIYTIRNKKQYETFQKNPNTILKAF